MSTKTLKTLIRTEYKPVPINRNPKVISSKTEISFHQNSMVREETREDFHPKYSKICIKKFYDTHWNIVDEAYYENDELITSSSTMTSGSSVNKSNQIPLQSVSTNDGITNQFSFIFAGKKTICEERSTENNLVIKRIFSKQVKHLKYIKNEIYQYY